MSEKTWKKATTLFPVLYDSVISSNVQYTQGGFGDVFKSYPGECVGWGGAGEKGVVWRGIVLFFSHDSPPFLS